MLVAAFRRAGEALYVGTGENVLPAVHVDDLAQLYALEKAPAATLLNAVAGPSVPVRSLAESASRAAWVEARGPYRSRRRTSSWVFWPPRSRPTSAYRRSGPGGCSASRPRGPSLLEDVERSSP